MTTPDASPGQPAPDRPLPDVDPLSRMLLRMAATLGSPAEFGLLEEHAQLLSRLLAPMAASIATGKLDLEFGLGSRLDLKINVISKGATPTTSLAHLVKDHPQLAEVTRLITRHRLSYQYGIRLSPGRAEIRVYPNESPGKVLANGIFREYRPETASCVPPYRGYGLTSEGLLSVYAWSQDDGIRERISALTGIQFQQGFSKVLLWEQARFDPATGWHKGKEAVQPHPFPVWIINRAIATLKLPHFAYFVTQPGLRHYGYLAREAEHLSLYAPMRWG